ncbi:MAG: SpoIIE family protein phosphatase [Chloroflexi bacterium]|nr:SpoIIE family protein phosphatase [Chloroflexota bacterium]
MMYLVTILLQAINNLSASLIPFTVFLAAMLVAVYVAGRRYRSRQLLLARVAELESLSAAGRAIVEAELDLDGLCAHIARESALVVDNRTFQIGLFAQAFYEIRYWMVDGREQPTPQSFDLSAKGGIVNWVRHSRQPLLVRDFERESDSLPARPRYISDSPPRSAIFIPLVSGEEVIGIIAAQSARPHRFDEEDLRRLMILANQAAAAIAHARLFAQVQKRAAQLELVGEIGREISRVQSHQELFERVVELTAETFGFHLVMIFGRAEKGDQVVLQAGYSLQIETRQLVIAPNEGLVGTAAVSRQTIISNDIRQDARYQFQNDELENSTRSEMAVPLLVDDVLLGVLDVQSQVPGFFTSIEKTALEALAAEIGIALNKLQQLARQREQAWLTTAQLQVAEAIGSSENREEMLAAVTRLTPILAGATFCAVLLWNGEHEQYMGYALFGGDLAAVHQFSQIKLTVGDWPALDAVHVGQEMLTTQRIPDWLRQVANDLETPLTQVTLAPLQTNPDLWGVMLLTIEELERAADNVRREELLQNITRQTAAALETYALRAAQQEEAWVNTALFQVAAAVNSLTDLNEILATIIRLVPLLVGVESALILIWDDAQQQFQAGPSHGIGEMGRGLLETLALERDEVAALSPGLIQQTDVTTGTFYDVHLPDWLEKVFSATRAGALPLAARGNLVGVMVVGVAETLSFRQINILTGVAHQAATAVVNNHLYQEAAERDRLEQELNVARDIQTSLLPAEPPQIPGLDVAGYWKEARQVGGDFYDFMELPGGRWGILIADVADKGVPAAIFMALSRTILRTIALNRINPAETLTRANEIILNDTQSDLFVTVFYVVWEPESKTLLFANGGHNLPILLRADGSSQQLKAEGIALGVLPEVTIECGSVPFNPGDMLVLYTDGITEAMNEDYDEFGLGHLQVAVEAARNKTAAELVTAVRSSIDAHVGDTPQFDDITLVIMKRGASTLPANKTTL